MTRGDWSDQEVSEVGTVDGTQERTHAWWSVRSLSSGLVFFSPHLVPSSTSISSQLSSRVLVCPSVCRVPVSVVLCEVLRVCVLCPCRPVHKCVVLCLSVLSLRAREHRGLRAENLGCHMDVHHSRHAIVTSVLASVPGVQLEHIMRNVTTVLLLFILRRRFMIGGLPRLRERERQPSPDKPVQQNIGSPASFEGAWFSVLGFCASVLVLV